MPKLTTRELLANLIFIIEKDFLPLQIIEKYFVAYKKISLYELNVNDVPVARPNLQINVRRAGLDDMKKLAEMRTRERNFGEHRVSKYLMLILERLKVGDWCFVAEKGDEILGYTWVTFHSQMRASIYNCEIGKILLKRDEAIFYDGYTFSSYRGKGVSSARIQQTIDYLRKSNFRRIYFMIMEYNKPSRRAIEKINGKAKETITFLRILTMSRVLRSHGQLLNL